MIGMHIEIDLKSVFDQDGRYHMQDHLYGTHSTVVLLHLIYTFDSAMQIHCRRFHDTVDIESSHDAAIHRISLVR